MNTDKEKHNEPERNSDETKFNNVRFSHEHIDGYVEKGFKRIHVTVKSLDKTKSVRLVFDYELRNHVSVLVERDKQFQIDVELHEDNQVSSDEFRDKLKQLDPESLSIIEDVMKNDVSSKTDVEINKEHDSARVRYNEMKKELYPDWKPGSERKYPKGIQSSSYLSCVGQYAAAGALLGGLLSFYSPFAPVAVARGATIGLMLGFTHCGIRYQIP